MKAVIMIDGAYLENVLINEHARAQVDYHKLAHGLVARVSGLLGQRITLLRTYYYHALPWLPEDPDESERERLVKKRGFFHRLEYLPRFTVKLGRTQRIVGEDGISNYQQKGVDVLLATDMVSLAARGLVEHIILLTPDSDFVPAVKHVRNLGAMVHLVHGSQVSASGDLRRECDERIEIDSEFVRNTSRTGNVRQPNEVGGRNFNY